MARMERRAAGTLRVSDGGREAPACDGGKAACGECTSFRKCIALAEKREREREAKREKKKKKGRKEKEDAAGAKMAAAEGDGGRKGESEGWRRSDTSERRADARAM